MAHPSPSYRPSSAPPRPASSADRRRGGQPYRDPDIDCRQLVVKRQAPRWRRDLKRYGWLPQAWPRTQYQPAAHGAQTGPVAMDRGCPGTVAACRARWHTADCASSPGRGNAGGLSAHRTVFHSTGHAYGGRDLGVLGVDSRARIRERLGRALGPSYGLGRPGIHRQGAGSDPRARYARPRASLRRRRRTLGVWQPGRERGARYAVVRPMPGSDAGAAASRRSGPGHGIRRQAT